MGKSSKAEKEAFVSNLLGGTALEVNEVTLVAGVWNQDAIWINTYRQMLILENSLLCCYGLYFNHDANTLNRTMHLQQ